MRTKPKKSEDIYEHHKVNTGFGAGPLRPRAILEESYGVCQGNCHSKKSKRKKKERLYGGLCDWCRWMLNDKETGEDWYG